MHWGIVIRGTLGVQKDTQELISEIASDSLPVCANRAFCAHHTASGA
jgi:hypothetical protein